MLYLQKLMARECLIFKNRIVRIFLLLLALLFLFCETAVARTVKLQWDTNNDADYYVVYWGEAIGDTTFKSVNINSPSTSYPATVLDDKTYYFSVKAFNNCGNSSDFSDWVKSAATEPSEPAEPSEPEVPGSGVDAPGPASTDLFEPSGPKSAVTDIASQPTIEVFDKNFQHLAWLKTGWSDYNDENGEARVATGDIDNDGEDEIIIGLGRVAGSTSIPGGYFQILDDDFSHMTWGRIEWGEYNDVNGESWPSCGDIDGDGDDEIIIGLGIGGKGYLEVFDFSGGIALHMSWLTVQWDEYNERIGETRPVCSDLDGDGIDEIIVGLGSQGGDNLVPGGNFEIFTTGFTHLAWGAVEWPEYTEINGETWPAPGDVDGDGQFEIVIGLGVGGQGKMAVFEYHNQDVIQSNWATVEWPDYNDSSGETRPVCGDIDEDGKDEIIVGLGPLYENPEIPEGFFQVLDDDFNLMEWGQIDNSDFNQINGSSRPVKGSINGDTKIIIGLGSWSGEDSQDDLPVVSPALAEGGSGSGCFISAADVY